MTLDDEDGEDELTQVDAVPPTDDLVGVARPPSSGPTRRGATPEKKAPPNSKAYVGDDVDTANPPYNSAWPSPAMVGFPSRGGKVGDLSLSSSLPPEYDAAVGGRGTSPKGNTGRQSVFAAARHRREAAARRARGADEAPEDIMAAETERPRPRKETVLTAGYKVSEPNAYGAKPDDVPVVSPLTVDEPGATPATAADASRFVTTKGKAPFDLAFAAGAAVDQPTRRFRPPDQSLCVGAGVAFTGNNLVLRTFDATTGVPIQGPHRHPRLSGVGRQLFGPGVRVR